MGMDMETVYGAAVEMAQPASGIPPTSGDPVLACDDMPFTYIDLGREGDGGMDSEMYYREFIEDEPFAERHNYASAGDHGGGWGDSPWAWDGGGNSGITNPHSDDGGSG